MSNNGGSRLYATSPVVRGVIFMAFSLPFVPIQRLPEGLELMRAEFIDKDDLIQNWCSNFLDTYIVQYWFEGPHSPNDWSVADHGEEHLTNNAAEGGNHRLLMRLGRHPNFYNFVTKIKSEIETTISKMHQAEQGLLSLTQTKRSKQVVITRRKLKTMLRDEFISLRRFMRAIGSTGSKVEEKGRLVHSEPEAEGLVQSVLTSVTDNEDQGLNLAGGRVRGRGREQGRGRGRGSTRRQCPGCLGHFAASYFYIHTSRYCTRVPGARGRRRNPIHSAASESPIEEEAGAVELDVDLDDDIDITVDNIMHEIDELDISLFNSTIQTSQPTVFQEPIISTPRARLRSRDEGGPSTRTRSGTSSLSRF